MSYALNDLILSIYTPHCKDIEKNIVEFLIGFFLSLYKQFCTSQFMKLISRFK